MSQEHRAAQIAASRHPKKHFDEHKIVKDENGEKSLEGQLPKILVGHPRHAGVNHPESEKMVKSAAVSKAIPVIGEADQDGD